MQREIREKIKEEVAKIFWIKQNELDEKKRLEEEEKLRLAMMTKQTVAD